MYASHYTNSLEEKIITVRIGSTFIMIIVVGFFSYFPNQISALRMFTSEQTVSATSIQNPAQPLDHFQRLD